MLVSTALLLRRNLAGHLSAPGRNATPAEWMLLELLAERDGQSVGEMADLTVKDRTTITRFVDGLVQKDWVHRRHDEADRRVVRVWLTAAGRRRRERLRRAAGPIIQHALREIEPSEVEHCLGVLGRVRANIVSGIGARG